MKITTRCPLPLLGLLLTVAATPLISQGQDAAAAPPLEVTGEMFGDFYWVVSNHTEELEHRTGWWFRRVYLTLDKGISQTWTTRTRLELNQPGDFETGVRMEPTLKDVYVQGTFGSHRLQMGLLPTPTFVFYEGAWGYRAVEKSPVDLYRLGASRDVGFAVQGAPRVGSPMRYHVTVGNGNGTGTEIDKGKNVAVAIGYAPAGPIQMEVYGEVAGLLETVNRQTAQASVSYRNGPLRAGGTYAYQNRRTEGEADASFRVASAFAVVELRPFAAAFARVDRQFQANPDAPSIPYFRFAEGAETTLFIAGVDVGLHDQIRLLPNLQVARYDRAIGTLDTMARLTLNYRF